MKRFAAFFLFSCFTAIAHAQFQAVYIGVNGLTCSQCSRTVEMSLRKLAFVADVQMNLQHTEGKILLKKDKKADIDKIAQAVVDAGFSVRSLQADFLMSGASVSSGKCFVYNGDGYVFIQAPKEPLTGTVKLRFIGKKFMPKAELKKVNIPSGAECTGITGKTYHVAANGNL